MSFDVRNAAQTFQSFRDTIHKDMDLCFAYIDNILVFICFPQARDQHIRTLFAQLQNYGILLNLSAFSVFSKFPFWHIKTRPWDPSPFPNVSLIFIPATPKNVCQLRRFLGMLNFYRRFLPRASSIQAPLHEVLSGPKPQTCPLYHLDRHNHHSIQRA
jgi:hypothetical protein